MGTVQLTLASKVAISWDTVSAIATKLATLANEGLDGFYSAVTWVQENQVETAAVVAIGLGLAAAAFVPGFLDHLLAGMQEPVDEVAGLPAVVEPAAELFAENMLAYALLPH